MATPTIDFRVVSIQLSAFKYNVEFNPGTDSEINYSVEISYRTLIKTMNLEVLVKIIYYRKAKRR